MFNIFRMNAFTVDRTYDDAHKIVSYVPTFNTTSKLEFNILPDKRYLLLNETVLKFGVELPEELIPSNFFAATLFQNLELYINHELVSHKSSDSDYFISEYFFKREAYNAPYDVNALVTEGYFEANDHDASIYTKQAGGLYKSYRRQCAVVETRDDVDYYKYYFCCTINHGLAKQDKPLPAGIPITLTFNRTKAYKSLLQLVPQRSGEKYTYEHESVPLINPVLEAYFVESKKAEQFYSKVDLYDIRIPFLDYSIRRELLTEGVAEHRLKLFEGPLPSVVLFGFQNPERFDGSYALSPMQFERHGLESFQVNVDGQPVISHPLQMRCGTPMEFYQNYLKETNRWNNMLSTGAMTYIDFTRHNFFIVVNLKADGYKHGQATLNLRFDEALADKLYCLFLPIYEKSLQFDSYWNAKVVQ